MAAATLPADPLLTTADAAAYLGISPGTLEVWRCLGRYGLRYHRIGRCVRYRRSDLDAWLASRAVTHTGQQA